MLPTNPALPSPPMPPPAAVADKLWKRLGEEEKVGKIVDDFLKRGSTTKK